MQNKLKKLIEKYKLIYKFMLIYNKMALKFHPDKNSS